MRTAVVKRFMEGREGLRPPGERRREKEKPEFHEAVYFPASCPRSPVPCRLFSDQCSVFSRFEVERLDLKPLV
jgi:hypothetical protein